MADLQDSDSSEGEPEPAPPEPGVIRRNRERYQRNYRRRRQLDANEMADSSASEVDMSDEGSYQGRPVSSEEISDMSEGSPNVEEPPVTANSPHPMQQDEQPENGDVIDNDGPQALEQENDAVGEDLGIIAAERRIDNNSDNDSIPSSDDSAEGSLSSPDVSEERETESSGGEGDGDDENARLYDGAPVTVAEALLAILSFFMRHKLSGQCLSDLLSLISFLCPLNNRCIKTLYQFKKYFSMLGQKVLVFHYFCSNCEVPLRNANDVCVQCGQANKASYFLELPLLAQLQGMFLRAGFYESLQFRFRRRKKFENNIEDIYDGEIYKQEMQNGFLRNPNNLSFLWYSDGIAIYKSTNFSIWPMFLVINELDYKTRTKRENIILAGIWFGKNKPNPNIFLVPLNNDLERLKIDGHLFDRADGPPILVKGKLLMCV